MIKTCFDGVVNSIIDSLLGCNFPCSLIQNQEGENGSLGIDVEKLQDYFCDKLNTGLSVHDTFQTEYQPLGNIRDKVDIYGKVNDINIVIELDSSRADQVAKKMLSRFSIFKGKPMIYVAIVYPGTEHMNFQEVVKYISYGKHLFDQPGHVKVIGMEIVSVEKNQGCGNNCKLQEISYMPIS